MVQLRAHRDPREVISRVMLLFVTFIITGCTGDRCGKMTAFYEKVINVKADVAAVLV